MRSNELFKPLCFGVVCSSVLDGQPMQNLPASGNALLGVNFGGEWGQALEVAPLVRGRPVAAGRHPQGQTGKRGSGGPQEVACGPYSGTRAGGTSGRVFEA